MIGRAGRAGFRETGESILICSNTDIPKVKSLLLSAMDEANSSLHENDYLGIKTFVLGAVGLGMATCKRDLLRLINCTLLSVQKDKFNIEMCEILDLALISLIKDKILYPKDAEISNGNLSLEMINDLCEDLTSNNKKLKIGLLTELTVTPHGKAAIKSGINIKKAQIIYDDLRRAQGSLVLLNQIHLLYLVSPYELAEQIRPDPYIYYHAYGCLKQDELIAAKVIGITEACMQRIVTGMPLRGLPETVYKRFYITLMLFELWNEQTVFQVSQRFKVNRGIVQQLMTSAASFAVNIRHFCENFNEFHCFVSLIDDLSARLAHCCTPELLPLMELPAVKKARAKQLFRAGYTNLQKIATCEPLKLVHDIPNLNTRNAIQIINTAKMILLKTVENLKEDAQELLNMNVDQPV